MNNFRFCVPTEILFGRNQEERLPEVLSRYGKKVLLTYGGGSIKRIGLYDKIMKLLKNFEVFELANIEPNPRVESARKGIEICKKENIDVVLAVGGGSTIDCSKLICAGAKSAFDAWDLVLDPKKINDALPLCTVLTLSATGSEMNNGGVISKMDTNEKLGFGNSYCLPKVSILNPENTFTVSAYQTAAGSVDIISHILEVYFSRYTSAVSERIAEGLLKTVIEYAPKALENPNDYEARASLMWASSLGLNGLVSCGLGGAWSCHPIEHELSAYYDITHGVGLAILTPRWMEYILCDKTLDRFVMYANNVWNINGNDKYLMAKEAIEKTYNFFKSLNIPMSLTELNIDSVHFEDMANHVCKIKNMNNAFYPLAKEDIINILNKCL